MWSAVASPPTTSSCLSTVGESWKTALPIRAWLVNSIPQSLKLATSAGIGFFLAIIALQGAGLVVDSPATLVTHGKLLAAAPLLALFGFAVIAALNQLKVPGATIIGILAVTLLGLPLGVARVLIADMAADGLVAVYEPTSFDNNDAVGTELLERVLSGLRRL